MIAVGWTPISIEPILSMGQDWEVTIKPALGSTTPVWPVGATVTAYIYPPGTDTHLPVAQWTQLYAWQGTISSDQNTVTFKGPYTQSDLVPAGALMRIRVVLPNIPTNDNFTWCSGTVVRND